MQPVPELYLCPVVVHCQHAEHMQGVAASDEFSHSVWQDALASLLCRRRLVSRRIGQLIHADYTVLRTMGMFCGKITNVKKKKNIFTMRREMFLPPVHTRSRGWIDSVKEHKLKFYVGDV